MKLVGPRSLIILIILMMAGINFVTDRDFGLVYIYIIQSILVMLSQKNKKLII